MAKEKQTIVQSVILRPLVELVPNPKNPRTATDEEIAALAESIKANPDYFDARPIVLSNRTGVSIEKAFKNSVAYIQGWLKSLKNDPKMILWAAGRAEKAAKYIMNEA